MKKQVLFMLFFALCAAFTASAQSDHSSIMFRDHSELSTPEVAFNSNVTFNANIHKINLAEMSIGGERAGRKYENAVKKRKGGIVLTAIGGTFLVGGSALLAVGAIGFTNDLNGNGSGYSPLTHAVEIAFGTIFALAGTGMTIPGAIILAKSSKDIRKYKESQAVN